MPSTLNKSPNPPAEIQLQTYRLSSILYCRRLQTHIFKLLPVSSSLILSSLFLVKFWLVTPQDNFPCFSTPILVPLGKFVSISLFPFQIFGLLTGILPFRPLLMSYLLTVYECTCFPGFWASSPARSKLVFLLFLRDVIFRYVLSFLASFRGLQLHFLYSTFPVLNCFFGIAWTPHLETPVWRAISARECPCSCNITTWCLVAIDIFIILGTVNIWFRS